MKNIQNNSPVAPVAKEQRTGAGRYLDLKLWWFALQKPVKEHDKKVWDSFDVIAKWLISTRATVTQLTLMAGVISGLQGRHKCP